MSRATLAVATLAVLPFACAAPLRPRPHAAPTSERLETPAPAPPRAVPRLPETVAVQLGLPPGPLVITGATRAPLRLERGTSGVRSASAELPEVLLAPLSGRDELELGGRGYPGRLRVRPSSGRSGGAGLDVTNLVALEDYVSGVLAAELSLWSARPAELEAQAIASRSWAVYELGQRGTDPRLRDDARDQVYLGRPRVAGRAGPEVLERLARAVEATRGQVLVRDGRVLDARFHAACGGRTAEGRLVFPEVAARTLSSVACEVCSGGLAGAPPSSAREASAPGAPWEWTASRAELDRLARTFELGPHLTGLTATRRDEAGRWLEVELSGPGGARRLPFGRLRAELGHERLRSSWILGTWPRAGAPIENGLSFRGRGHGHGVGLCQAGARGLARAGWSAERILAHYYPGSEVATGRSSGAGVGAGAR